MTSKKLQRLHVQWLTEYGMSDLGPIQYEQRSGNVFLGRDYNKDKNFSDHLARQIDEEIHKIISECYNRCRKVLLSNQDLVKLIAETLLQYETLTKEQIDELVEKGKLETTAYSVADSKEDKKQPKFKLVREGNYKLKSTLTVSKEKLPIIDFNKRIIFLNKYKKTASCMKSGFLFDSVF